MAKEAFYFTHDYGSRNDPKLQKVMMKLGHEGKSVYWDLVEMLYEEGGYLLLEECDNYAFALRTQCDCIQKLVNDFDLFKKNDTNFWSESILRRLDKRDEKSKKASQSAKTRWDKANALKSDANALRQECEGNAIKESKVKKSKVEEIEITEASSVNNLPIPKKKDSPLYTSMVSVWFEDTHPGWVFAPIDGRKIKSIIEKIKAMLKKANRDYSDEATLVFFKLVCQNLPEFFRDKELKAIDGDFNQIIEKIKESNNGKKPSNAKQSTYSSTKEAFSTI